MFPSPAYESGGFSVLRKQANKPVVIFATPACPYCKQARELLMREGVDYRDYVIDLSP
ncbi:glutaredoxin family protein [Luteimonas panaciterrae]|uniref:glutaredoxin family protein n=1 Tax=Luteimonas panaciterrae TaxID=363885 RepID=UPI001CFBBB43|nr:glutaredoxin domain-containing protein [Luteimonas panaciterrae]